MKLRTILVVSLALCQGVTTIQAQETNNQANQIQQLQQQLRQLQDSFEKEEQQHRQQLEALRKQMEALQQTQARPAPGPAQTSTESASPSNPELATAVEKKGWSPADPIRVGRGGTYADLSLVATFAAGGSTASDIEGGTQLGGHDPNQRGFTVQGAEINLQGAVDPYFRGNANLAFLLNAEGESSMELEEAWLETFSLPANLQVRAGQYLTEFGRINTQHPHAWAFVDAPLVNGRLLGEDGLRNPGVRLSWLVPTPFYSELFFGVQNSQGGTAHSFRSDHEGGAFFDRLNGERRVKTISDMMFSTRYTASFDLSDTQTLLGGASAAFGPNSSGSDTDTQIYGLDLYWKWKSPNAHGGFPFVSWQTEVMLRRYQAGAFTGDVGEFTDVSLPRETSTDWGMYSQVLWGFKPGWVAGLRGDYVTGDTAAYEKLYGADLSRAMRWRISPNLTWYPSEFSKLRLQYNYDDRDQIGVDHSVWLQFEFLLGAHAAHKF
jgi:hypothetical protein